MKFSLFTDKWKRNAYKMFCCRYSLEYASPDKSAFHALFSDKAKKANITDPGVCHGDELM